MERLLRRAKFRLMTLKDCDLYADYAEKATGALSPHMSFESLCMWQADAPVYWREVGKFLLLVTVSRTRARLICYPPIGDYKHYSLARPMETLSILYAAAEQSFQVSCVKDWMLPYFRQVGGFTLQEDYDMDACDIQYQALDFVFSLRRAEAQRRLAAIREALQPEALDYDGDREPLLRFFNRQQCDRQSCAVCRGLCARASLERAMDLSDQLGMAVRYAQGTEGIVGITAYTVLRNVLIILFFQADDSVAGADYLLREMIAEDMTDHVRYVDFAADINRASQMDYKRSLSHYIQTRNYTLTVLRGAAALPMTDEADEGEDTGEDENDADAWRAFM